MRSSSSSCWRGGNCWFSENEIREIGPGDLAHIPRGTLHGAYTLTDKAVAFAVKSPSGDGRVEQDYNEAENADEVAERLRVMAEERTG